MNDWTVLVCGGAGFIGSNFVRYLLRSGVNSVVVLDKLTYAGNRLNLPLDPRVEFVHGDIGNRELVLRTLELYRPRWVVNFAAETHVDRSIDGPEPFLLTNVVGTFVLLEAVRTYLDGMGTGASGFRFLQVSTDEVYGTLPEGLSAHERFPYEPRSPYAASKAAGDHFVASFGVTYQLPVLLTHCSNNFGPYQYPEKLIPLMILNALDGLPLPVYGDGLYVRDWLYVDDHCDALLRVLQAGQEGTHYNIGAGNEMTNLQVVYQICELLESTLPASENPVLRARGVVSYRELITFVEDRPGHDRRYSLDFSKIQRELGWRPQNDFQTALEKTIQWYRANRRWCADVLSGCYNRERIGLGKTAASK